jgi:hypothetical protein
LTIKRVEKFVSAYNLFTGKVLIGGLLGLNGRGKVKGLWEEAQIEPVGYPTFGIFLWGG